MLLHFAKYEGAGNDFVLVDARDFDFDPGCELVSALCDRHFGIGADGMMSLSHTPHADFRMRYYNSDGREATMCGNGGRCITLFAHHLGIGGRTKRFLASDGMHQAKITSSDDTSGTVELQMCDVQHVSCLDDHCQLDTGSPHYVTFVEDTGATDVFALGRKLRNSIDGGTNVNFVQPIGPDSIRIRTYERGVEDETLACGTGATAAAIASFIRTGSSCRRWTVQAVGGVLTVEFTPESDGTYTNIHLTGGARKVFSGRIETSGMKLKSK